MVLDPLCKWVDKTDTLLNKSAVETGLHNITLIVQTASSPNIYLCNKIKRCCRNDINPVICRDEENNIKIDPKEIGGQ
jgi:hypothetical protein